MRESLKPWSEWYLFSCQIQLAALAAIIDARRKGAAIVVRGYEVKQRVGRELRRLEFPPKTAL